MGLHSNLHLINRFNKKNYKLSTKEIFNFILNLKTDNTRESFQKYQGTFFFNNISLIIIYKEQNIFRIKNYNKLRL